MVINDVPMSSPVAEATSSTSSHVAEVTAITPSNQTASPSELPDTPRSTKSYDANCSNVFKSQTEFVDYLSQHPKSKLAMLQITSGTYSVAARRSITQVTVSKLIDVYGYDITTALKQKVSSWLADITGMKTSDYFDPKTHRGFLNKDLMNRRRKLPPENKRWIWSKKVKSDVPHSKVVHELSWPGDGRHSPGGGDLLELDGCPRLITDCQLCQGK